MEEEEEEDDDDDVIRPPVLNYVTLETDLTKAFNTFKMSYGFTANE